MEAMTAQTIAYLESVVGRPAHLVGWSDGAVPVSYTHLRAHETVLDLVCRLLLEKQTKKTKQHRTSTPVQAGKSKMTTIHCV